MGDNIVREINILWGFHNSAATFPELDVNTNGRTSLQFVEIKRRLNINFFIASGVIGSGDAFIQGKTKRSQSPLELNIVLVVDRLDLEVGGKFFLFGVERLGFLDFLLGRGLLFVFAIIDNNLVEWNIDVVVIEDD